LPKEIIINPYTTVCPPSRAPRVHTKYFDYLKMNLYLCETKGINVRKKRVLYKSGGSRYGRQYQ